MLRDDVHSCSDVAHPNAASASLICNAYAEEGTSQILGISLLCIAFPTYTFVCVDNLKKSLGESRKPNRHSRFPLTKLYWVGAKSRLIQNLIEHRA